nr:hypothetical protein [Tanacetum cinerariifolium]
MDALTPTSVAPLPMTAPTMTPSTIATITATSQEPILPTTALSTIIQDLPNFGSLFGFDNRLKTLEANFFEFMQTNQFVRAFSAIPRIVQRYMDQRMNEAVKVAVQIQDGAMMMLIRMKNPPLDQTGGPRDAKKERSLSQQALQKRKQPGALASQHKGLNLDRRAEDQPIVQSSQHPEWFSQQQKPPTPDPDWNKTLPAIHESIQPWISELAKQTDSRSSFNELMDTPLDFSNFLINRLKVDTLTPELLDGPTYELMKGSCKSLLELEYHLEDVFKATTDQLDWIEDLVPRTMWIEEPIGYDKHALWGVSHWGRKHQQFYGFAVNQESARDVYSKRRIIAVTELKIVE